MFCPNCGNDCGSAGKCNICGQELTRIQLVKLDSLLAHPVGIYEGLDGTLEISLASVTVRKQLPSQQTEQVILLDDIACVTFRLAAPDGIGFLALRDIHSEKPPVETEEDAACDEMALILDANMNSEFADVYTFLNSCASKKNQEMYAGKRKKQPKTMACPKCGSDRCEAVHVNERPTASPKIYHKSYILAWLLRKIRKSVIEGRKFVCLDCGCQWYLQKKEHV